MDAKFIDYRECLKNMNEYTCNYIKDPNNDVEISFYHR